MDWEQHVYRRVAGELGSGVGGRSTPTFPVLMNPIYFILPTAADQYQFCCAVNPRNPASAVLHIASLADCLHGLLSESLTTNT